MENQSLIWDSPTCLGDLRFGLANFVTTEKKYAGIEKKDFLDAWERYLSGTDGTDLKNKGLLNNLSGTKSKSVPHKKNDSFNKNKGVPLVPAGASLLRRNWGN